ncbi:MAG TPA: cell wall protein, partial [Brevundimonas sp.]|nr:cell wall protein [Brevundimonas sp.]
PLPDDEGVEPIGPEVTEPAIPETEPVEPPPETEVPIQPPPTLPTDNRTSEESVRPD